MYNLINTIQSAPGGLNSLEESIWIHAVAGCLFLIYAFAIAIEPKIEKNVRFLFIAVFLVLGTRTLTVAGKMLDGDFPYYGTISLLSLIALVILGAIGVIGLYRWYNTKNKSNKL